MSGLRNTLVTVTTTAPVLAAITAATPAMAGVTTDGGGSRPAPTPPPGGHYVTWKNGHNGEYLHVKGGSKSNSAVINTYTGSGSCAEHGEVDLQCEEEWSQISTGYAHEFAYANINSGLCLDDGENALTTPTQYSCGTYPENKRWIYNDLLFSDHHLMATLRTPYSGPPQDPFRVMCTDGTGPSLYVYSNVHRSQYDSYECSWH
jgi:hypothetical protein